MGPCKADVARIARAVCLARLRGAPTYKQAHIEFEPYEGGWCIQFVRQVCAVAERLYNPHFDEFSFEWLSRYPSEVCAALDRLGYRTDSAEPGDIVGMSPGYRKPGHLGICLGSQIAHNTNNPKRGPGTVLTPTSELQHMISGCYALYPARAELGPDLTVVGPAGEALACHPSHDRGRTRVDLGPLAEALGCDCFHHTQADGRKRIYVRPRT